MIENLVRKGIAFAPQGRRCPRRGRMRGTTGVASVVGGPTRYPQGVCLVANGCAKVGPYKSYRDPA